jgi:hypothetical protein
MRRQRLAIRYREVNHEDTVYPRRYTPDVEIKSE